MDRRVVVGLGGCTVDYLGLVPRYPERDERVEVAEFSQQGGGAVATALATLAVFGVPTRFAGKISDDPFGQFIRTGLENLGVELGQLVVEPGKVSPYCFTAVEMGEGSRTMFWTRGSVSALAPDELDFDRLLSGATLLLVDGDHVPAQIRAAEAAQRLGATVVLDGGPVREGVGDLLELCDVIIASERFATEIAAAPELEQSLEELQRLGPTTCVITLGPDGAIGRGPGGEIHREPALRVDVVDTTGAGDVYHGAYVYAMLSGWPLARTMKVASVAAGLKCRHLGARAGIPELAEVLAVVDAVDS